MDFEVWPALPNARALGWQLRQPVEWTPTQQRSKTALNVIAETKAFLDVNVVVECPNGEEVTTIARLDTA